MEVNKILTIKEIRIASRQITQLFGKKSIFIPRTIEELEYVGLSLPSLKLNGSAVWLSDSGKNALIKLSELFLKNERYEDYLDFDDVTEAVKSNYQKHLDKATKPTPEDFCNEVIIKLDGLIDVWTNICEVEGLSFVDLDYLELGHGKLEKFNESMLDAISFKEGRDEPLRESLLSKLKGKLVFLGSEKGSSTFATTKFKHNANISLSILRVFICSNFKGGFTHSHIRLRSVSSFEYQGGDMLGWSSTGKWFTSGSASQRQVFDLSTKHLEQFNEFSLYSKISDIVNKKSPNELEAAIIKSLYWFGEAHSDSSLASAWLKLWSCLECFFSKDSHEITEANARGIASIFMYGDIDMKLKNIVELQDYKTLKSTIKKYYKLRSAVAHRAEYKKVDEHSTILLSYIVGTIILSITCLACRGYGSLERISKESMRLDKI